MSDISLKEYFEQRFDTLEKDMNKASAQMDKRLEGMNEFRSALKDQSGKFLTKDEFNIQHLRVQDDIRILRESKATLEGKASQTSVFISYAIALISFVVAIISYFHKI